MLAQGYCIDFFGPTDFLGYEPPKGSEATVGRTAGTSLLVKLFGGPVDQKRELARDASPVTWVSKDSAPLYIEQGTNDPLVPHSQSERLAARYRAAGAEVTLDIIPGAGHGGAQFLNAARVGKLLAFLNKHVGRVRQVGATQGK
jgi:acetyl esterase/lipase